MTTATYPVISGNRYIQGRYMRMRDAGQSHNMAEMLAFQKAPMPKGTDRAFLEGDVINHGLGDMAPFVANQYIEKAAKAGINITGKVYKSGLADWRGGADPEAWVSDSSDVLRVAKKRNLQVRGAVNHAGREVEPPKDVPLAESIIQREGRKILAQEPMRDPREVREQVIEKHGARK